MPHHNNSWFLPDGLFGGGFDILLTGLPITNPTIRIDMGDGDHEGTLRHEFGHFVMWCLHGKNYIALIGTNGWHHTWTTENTSRLAWTEGWGDAMEMILDAAYWNEDQEYGRDEHGHFYERRDDQNLVNRGIWSEYYIACAIYDLWDGSGKGVPTTVGTNNTYVGFDDRSANGVPQWGWTEADNTELSFYQIARPMVLRSGISNKINHIGEYFSELNTNVIGTGNCTSVNAVSTVFAQNRVVYDVGQSTQGNGLELSSDLVKTQRTESISGTAGGLSFSYSDTYDVNPFANRTDVYNIYSTTSTSALTDDIFLNGDPRNTSTLAFQPNTTNLSAVTFYTCGNIEINTFTENIVLGGASSSARLEIRAGSLFRMRSGTSLTINNNSTLFIGCGAQLIFEPGASITLVGSNSRIIIDGTLTVLPGATFNYPYTLETPVISGVSPIPATGSTYSVNLLNAATYTWTVPAGWKINSLLTTSLVINGAGGSSVTIQPPSCGGSAGQICATISGCANTSTCRTVSIASCAADALNFDGSNDFVNIPEKNGRLNLGTGPFVIEAYIKSNASGSVRSLLSKRTFASGSSSDGFLFGTWSDGLPFIQMQGSPNILPPAGSANLYDGKCHQVAVRRSGTTISFFVDGVFIGNGDASSSRSISSTGPVRIATDPVTTSAYNGWIGEARIWNIALTNAQISANLGVNLSPQTGLMAYYDMRDGSSSQLVTDLSTTVTSTQNNGTLGSSSTSDTNDPLWLTSSQITCSVQGNFREASPRIDNRFSPDSAQIKAEAVVSSKRETINGITVYPNPSSNGFYVQNTTEDNLALKVSTVTGIELDSKKGLEPLKTCLLGTTLPPGVYFIVIEGRTTTKTIKVIKN